MRCFFKKIAFLFLFAPAIPCMESCVVVFSPLKELFGTCSRCEQKKESIREKEVREFFLYLRQLPFELKQYVAKLLLEDGLSCNFEAVRHLTGHTRGVTAVVFSPDGKIIATGSRDTTVCLRLALSRKAFRVFVHGDGVTSVAFSPDSKTIIIGLSSGIAYVRDITSGNYLILRGHSDEILAVAWNPDGGTILTGSGDGTARLWDAQSGKELKILLKTEKVYSVVFSPDGKTVLTGESGGVVRLWNVQSWCELKKKSITSRTVFGLGSPACSAVFSPDGKTALICLADCVAYLWNLEVDEKFLYLEEASFVKKFDGGIFCEGRAIACAGVFSPDGKTVLTGSLNGSVCFWDVLSRKLFLEIDKHKVLVSSMVFSPDGKDFLTGSDDGTVCLCRVIPCDASDNIQKNIMPLGAWFIARAFEGRRVGRSLSFDKGSFEYEIFKVFPENVQEYIAKWYIRKNY